MARSTHGFLAGALACAALVLAACSGGTASGPAKPITKLETQDFHSVAITPGDTQVAFFGHHNGILKSTDGGKSWKALSGVQADAMNLAVAGDGQKTIYLAGHEVFMHSTDGGATWRNVTTNLPGLDLHWFAVHPDDPRRLYALAVGHGTYTSGDGGATWEPWQLKVQGQSPVTTVGVLGGDPLTVLTGAQDGTVLRSTDGGGTWQDAGRLGAQVTVFARNPDSGTVYAGTTTGLHRSTDGGQSWTPVASVQTTVLTVAAAGTPERVIVVSSTGEVFRSNDGGKTW